MEALLIPLVLVALLLLFFLLPSKETPQHKSPRKAPQTDPLRARVEAHVAALDQAEDVARDAERRLLGMGPQVIVHLLGCLESVDTHPLALTPKQQVALESILSDFGPQILLQIRRLVPRVHRISPTYPALLRVLQRLENTALLDALVKMDRIPFALVAPLVLHVESSGAVMLSRPEIFEGPNAQILAIAVSPLLSQDPQLVDRLSQFSPQTSKTLHDILNRWGGPEWKKNLPFSNQDSKQETPRDESSPIPLSNKQLQTFLQDEITFLDEGPHHNTPEALLARLSLHLHDPRIQDRFLNIARSTHPLAALAFSELTRAEIHPEALGLASLMTHLLSNPPKHPKRTLHLYQALQRCPECQGSIRRALFQEQQETVLMALEVLSVGPLENHLRMLLKALSFHRYTPLEALICAPILSRWFTLEGPLKTLLEGEEESDICESIIELLSYYGTSQDLPRLMPLWGRHPRLSRQLFNAVEMFGPSSIPLIQKTLSENQEAPEAPALQRRLELLQLLKGSPHP